MSTQPPVDSGLRVERTADMTGAIETRSALVTGASRGIGHGIAASLARQGFGLTITARDSAALELVAEHLRALGARHVAAVAADLADPESPEIVVRRHAESFDSVDALILNAGVGTAGTIADFPMKRFDKTIDVNLRAPFELLQRSLPLLRTAALANPERGARVIALSSLTGVYAEAGLAAYGATKAAMLSLVDTLNAEESGNGISGTAFAPGYVETDMSAWIQDRIPAETMIRVADIVTLVDAVLRLSPRATVSTIAITRAGSGLQA